MFSTLCVCFNLFGLHLYLCAHSLYTPLCNVMDTLSLYVCVSTAPPVSVLLYSCTFIFFGQNPLSVLSSLPPSLPPPLYIQHILLLINPLKLFDLITLISLLSLLSLCLSVFPVSLLSLSLSLSFSLSLFLVVRVMRRGDVLL